MVVYDTAALFVQSRTAICDKIVAIDAIIAALEVTALTSASTDNIEEYWLDDGQTKIRTVYKGTDQILKSIESFIRLRNYYESKLNGRTVRLVDGKSLRR